MLKTIQDKARHRTRPLWAWLKLLWQRIDEDNMTTLAGNLAYVSLLSLVPLVAVVFALFAAFPMFSDVSIQLRHFIFANFLPATGDVIQRYIEQFVANSNKMTAVGACGLIVTALLLMYSIDSALNTIWRSKRARPKIYSFAVYWMILTLGPLLAGASLAISAYLLSLRWASDLNTVIDNVLRIFPLLLSWISFWLLYSIVPTIRVPNRDAIVGAFVRSRKERFRALYHHVPIISAHLRCAGGDPHSLCLGLLDMVYRLAWRGNYCHSRGIPQIKTGC